MEDRADAFGHRPSERVDLGNIAFDPVDVEARDTSGLYQKAREGALRHVTGISAPYERPISADIVVDTAACSLEECCEIILSELERRSLIKR